MDKLIVKNFGPLKEIDIDLNHLNIFIGENGSGKSVLAKLITVIFNAFTFSDEKDFLKALDDFDINYISPETRINLISQDDVFIAIEGESVFFHDKMRYINKIFPSLGTVIEDLSTLLKNFENQSETDIAGLNQLREDLKINQNKYNIFSNKFTSKYIPAERNLVSLLNKSLSTLLIAEVPIPKYLLQFSSDFEKATDTIRELDLLNVKYSGNGKHKIYYGEKDYLDLEHSSSGIQSALPMYITAKYFFEKEHTVIIEEPEQNLFPKAQKETVEFLVANRKKSQLFMMTHSPYILTALNNLILANDVKEKKGIDAIKGIIDEGLCVPFENVAAYSIENGVSRRILEDEERLIGVNIIDGISDEVSNVFDRLLSQLD